jgi:hypothetical protein
MTQTFIHSTRSLSTLFTTIAMSLSFTILNQSNSGMNNEQIVSYGGDSSPPPPPPCDTNGKPLAWVVDIDESSRPRFVPIGHINTSTRYT